MIEVLRKRGISNTKVLDIFRKVDRKFFLRSENDGTIAADTGVTSPYADVPRPIGWKTTISAPGMHGETLQHLYDKLKTATSVLDIGTGSGFITAAMAQVAPDQATIYAVDHIQEINDFAKANIQRICPHLLKKNKIQFVTQDGRQGLRAYNGQQLQYEVIHVGGQLNEIEDQEEYILPANPTEQSRKIKVDRVLLDQLAPGGRMWIPLLSKESSSEINLLEQLLRGRGRDGFVHHEVYLIDRHPETKELSYKKIMDARYAQLRSVDE